MQKKSAKEIIKELSKYRKYGVVIMGPTGTERNLLRVYVNGGDIGRISIDDETSHEILNDHEYQKYLLSKKDNDRLLELINEANGEKDNSRDKGEILCDEDYIACMTKATNYRFHNCNKENNYQLVKSERLVGTSLISQQGKIRNENGNLLIYDMEYAIELPTRPNKENPNQLKTSKPDFIVFDGTNIGIVELKYNSESMTGYNSLGEHFEDFTDFIWNGTDESKWAMVNESIYRIECLRDMGLVDESWHKGIKELREWHDANASGVFGAERLWIGFYFVEGPRERKNGQEDYVQKQICKQLAQPMKDARERNQKTKVLYGYWKDDKNLKLFFDKEIMLDEAENVSFVKLQK